MQTETQTFKPRFQENDYARIPILNLSLFIEVIHSSIKENVKLKAIKAFELC